MAEAREFKPLKDLGSIVVSDASELRFYVDEYKGFKYGSIRTFVKGEGYSGPTKSGVTMNPAVLAGVIEALGKLPAEPAAQQDRELARLPKKLGVELVVRVTFYKETAGIDIREWVEDESYKGWSKKGVRIPYGELGSTLKRLAQMQQVVGTPRPKA
ncbi:MAG: hypothetical protein KGO96_05805 [Elusimicrobia bacterium]|nr:hypothetical protein [Elusimicrobiota bacterium]MDE2425404.1 hypothetical protein [Elusimicrobiota bacterium]